MRRELGQIMNLPANTGDVSSIPGLGRSPGGGQGSPLQYSCLENPMDRGAWRDTVHEVAKSWAWLSGRATAALPGGSVNLGRKEERLRTMRAGGLGRTAEAVRLPAPLRLPLENWEHPTYHLQGHLGNWFIADIVQRENCACLGPAAEKAMAPHSSTLTWKLPWTEEPGRLQSMGSLRVRHDWATSLSLFTFMHWRRQWQPTPVFLPGESQGRGSLVGCRLWGRTELDTTEAT